MRSFRAVVLAGLVLGLGATGTGTSLADPSPDNPLAGGTWGVYTGSGDGVYPAYNKATGPEKDLLAKVALRPRVRWLGHWITDDKIGKVVSDYVEQNQAGDPDALVHLAMFRLNPLGESRRAERLSVPLRRSYKNWVNNAATAIGNARVAMVLEPDLALVLKARPKVRLRLTKYAARVFGGLPRTSVYIDASDSDWLKVPDATAMLLRAGVAYTRGFALGATHYTSTEANIAYGSQIVAALDAAGIPGKHFVIDTADNGQPFTWPQFWAKHPKGDFDNADTCTSLFDTRCVTLGIPPTADVANPAWGLSAEAAAQASQYVDAYLWFGRPWLYRQASPFRLDRTLSVAATTPY